jgi:hypothetical protein
MANGVRSRRPWTEAQLRVLEPFARAVVEGRLPNAMAAARECRRKLPAFPVTAIHAMMLKCCRRLGRPLSHVAWTPPESAVLDRFARLVAEERYRTARSAEPDCLAALERLHRRYPARYAGMRLRTNASVRHHLWQRVARLRSRWFHSTWSAAEDALLRRFSRAVLARKYPHMRDAARACTLAVNRMHARKEGRPESDRREVRSFAAVTARMYDITREMDVCQLPYRRWTAEERRVTSRWARRYERYREGKSRAKLLTLAGMMSAELARRGYYRSVHACAAKIFMLRRGKPWPALLRSDPRPRR